MLGRPRDELLVAQLLRELFDVGPVFLISFFSRSHSADRSITPLSGMATVASPSTNCTAPLGGSAAKLMLVGARKAADDVLALAPAIASVASLAPTITSGAKAPGRHVRLGADGAHVADELDHPVDFIVGGLVLEAVEVGPLLKR